MDKSIDLEVVISAKDEASASLASLQKSAVSLGKEFTVVGGILAGALAIAVKSASDAEAQMAKFDATLNTMGKAGKEARDILLKQADATLKLGFDNEEAAVSLGNLYQRTGNVTQAIKLNALAMDLARAKSIDLTTATTLVGQVMSGNGKVLKQYGINIKDSATPLEALGILQDKVGGQATAFAGTFKGASEILKQQVGELQEKIGNQLLPILTSFLSQVTPLISKLLEWTSAHPELTKNIVLATSALAGLLLVLGPVLIAIGMITGPMLIVAGVITALAVAVFELVKHWDEVKVAMTPVIAQLQDMAIQVGQFLKPFVDALVFSLKLLWAQLQALWTLVAPVLLPVLEYLGKVLGTSLVVAIALLIAGISGLALIIAGFVQGLQYLIEKLMIVYNWFTVDLPAGLTALQTSWTNTWNSIKATTDSVVNYVQGKINALMSAWNSVQAMVNAPINAVSGAVKNVVSTATTAISGKKAGGGTVDAGSSYLVGERGPELFTPSLSGRITANGAGGGGITVNINGGTYLSENVALEIGNMIANRLKMVSRIRV